MTNQDHRSTEAPAGRVVSRVVMAVVVGWLVVYNIMRISGDNPAQAWRPSLILGGGLGLLVAGGLWWLQRKLAESGRVLVPRVATVSGTLDEQQRDAMQVSVPIMLSAAVAAGITAVAELAQWFGESDRSLGLLVFVIWNLVFAGWMSDEGMRLRGGHAEGLDTVFFGCLLTTVLAGVAFARGVLEPVQVILALVSGAAGIAVGLVVWRLAGGRGIPTGPIIAVLVTAATLAIAVLA